MDGAGWKVGAVEFPVTTDTSLSTLRVCDPALFYALDFFAAMMRVHIEPRLLAECAVAPAVHITSAVAQKFPYDPGAWMQEEQLKFPLLAIFRKTSRSNYVSAVYMHDASEWQLEYTLPPLTAAQAERLLPVLSAVPTMIAKATEQGWYPGYVPPGALPDAVDTMQVWGERYANIEKILVHDWAFGFLKGAGNLLYPNVDIDMTVVERAMPITSGPNAPVPFQGADIDEQVDPGDGSGVLDAVVQLHSDVTPPKAGA